MPSIQQRQPLLLLLPRAGHAPGQPDDPSTLALKIALIGTFSTLGVLLLFFWVRRCCRERRLQRELAEKGTAGPRPLYLLPRAVGGADGGRYSYLARNEDPNSLLAARAGTGSHPQHHRRSPSLDSSRGPTPVPPIESPYDPPATGPPPSPPSPRQ